MTEIFVEPLHEKVITHVLESGMNVIILEKPGFQKKAATLLIPFGSIDQIIPTGNAKPLVFPEGTAHFLEHMVFENENRDITREFALMGASPNAYTTFNRTALYFSTTNGLEKPLGLLFEMLQNVDFDLAAIRKERSIIDKEIDMYRDDVEQRLYFDTIRSLYHHHAIKSDIAGTRESIQAIDDETLMSAFKMFYRPDKMVLVLTGAIDGKKTCEWLEKLPFLAGKRHDEARASLNMIESTEVVYTKKHQEVDVMNDMVMIGIKLDAANKLSAWDTALLELKWYLLLENVFGKLSRHYETMQKRKLVNNSFDITQTIEPSFAHIIMFAETGRPDVLSGYLIDVLTGFSAQRLDPDSFERHKRKLIGDYVQVFDSITQANNLIAEYAFRGVDLFQLIKELDRIGIEDIELLKKDFPQNTISVVEYHKSRIMI